MNINLSLVVGVLVLAFFLRRAYTDVDDAFVDEWAGAHALPLTEANRPMVAWYLHTARVLRTWGAVAGLLLPPLIGAALGSKFLEDQLFPLVYLGYLAGALYAELALVRPTGGGRRQATLVPRELEDYLPRRLLVAQRVLAALVAASAVAVLLVSFERQGDAFDGSPRPTAAVVGVFAVVLAFALERLERWLVQRPQPFTAPDLIAADDAIRSQSVHSLAGAGLATLLFFLGGTSFTLALSDVQVLRWAMWVPAMGCFVLSLWVCLYYGHRAWRVRRRPGTAAPSPA